MTHTSHIHNTLSALAASMAHRRTTLLPRLRTPWLCLLVACLLVACHAEWEEPAPHREGEAVILFGSSKEGGDVMWHDGRATSRAEGMDVASTTPDDIGVFAFGDGRNTTYIFRNQRAMWQDGIVYKTPNAPAGLFPWNHPTSIWPYTTDATGAASVQQPWERMHYRFFAYSPWYETQHVSVSAENYSGFNSFKWDNVPGFSARDFVLSNKIIDCDNTAGTYTTAGNIIHFEMRHILSRIRFFFKMSSAYKTLRNIELNSLTALTAGKVKSATFNFKNNAWDETVNWSNEKPGDADPVTLVNKAYNTLTGRYEDNPHYDVPTAYPDHESPYASIYVYPQAGFSELKIRLNYTVRDQKGVVTRHAQVTNAINLPAWTLLSGYYYDIKISIVPDYLYVLSDNDQDFDGWVVIKDEP